MSSTRRSPPSVFVPPAASSGAAPGPPRPPGEPEPLAPPPPASAPPAADSRPAEALIAALERRELEELESPSARNLVRSSPWVERPSSAGALLLTNGAAPTTGDGVMGARFLQVQGVGRFWEEPQQQQETGYWMEDVLCGLHGQGTPWSYLLHGERNRVSLYLGVWATGASEAQVLASLENLMATFQSALRSRYPYLSLSKLSEPDQIKGLLQPLRAAEHCGVMMGVPTFKGMSTIGQGTQLDRLIRGLYGESWLYLVLAEPLPERAVLETMRATAEEMQARSDQVRQTRQMQQSSKRSVTFEEVDRLMEYYVELLEATYARLKVGRNQGMWRVGAYFLAPQETVLHKARSLLRACFSGNESRPEPVRVFACPDQGEACKTLYCLRPLLAARSSPAGNSLAHLHGQWFQTALTSPEVATLAHLPREEVSGYAIKNWAGFGAAFPERGTGPQIAVGAILDRGEGTGNRYTLPVHDLTRHGLIVGITGSGKTNTCLYLLDQLWRPPHRIPFMVIEPAKSEYRCLRAVEENKQKPFEDLQVFTLGDDQTSPFRLNPFEVLGDTPLQSHIDFLKSTFNASFVMYAPMPYVLEQCLHEVYEDKGWNLATGENRYAEGHKGERSDLFPTLTDLYEKVDPVVAQLGYEQRIAMDVKAGLKARLNSLRIGGKGAMLDTRRSIPMETLLSKPTILELKRIGDDEEKAFVIGLIMVRLYEYLESKGHYDGLRHLTLVEEAHRLLQDVPTDAPSESANTKGKAVELFCNILAEIRAYGEGLLIAEQIPMKLAKDAIKNTNLKVMHRLVSEEDRAVMGGAMSLDQRQEDYVAVVEKGVGVVYAEAADKPFLVRVPNYKGVYIDRHAKTFKEAEVAQFMADFRKTHREVFLPFTSCVYCQEVCRHRGTAARAVTAPELEMAFAKFSLAAQRDASAAVKAFPALFSAARKAARATETEPRKAKPLVFCVLVQLLERLSHVHERLFGRPRQAVADVREAQVQMVAAILRHFLDRRLEEIAQQIGREVAAFRQQHQSLTRQSTGPLPGCELCQHRCALRLETAALLADDELTNQLVAALRSGEDVWARARQVCDLAAARLVEAPSKDPAAAVALCYFVQKAAASGVSNARFLAEQIFAPSAG